MWCDTLQYQAPGILKSLLQESCWACEQWKPVRIRPASFNIASVTNNSLAGETRFLLKQPERVRDIYGHPLLKYPPGKLPKGAIVEHRDLPGVGLIVEEGPEQGISGQVYKVRKPDGKIEPVLRKNLII